MTVSRHRNATADVRGRSSPGGSLACPTSGVAQQRAMGAEVSHDALPSKSVGANFSGSVTVKICGCTLKYMIRHRSDFDLPPLLFVSSGVIPVNCSAARPASSITPPRGSSPTADRSPTSRLPPPRQATRPTAPRASCCACSWARVPRASCAAVRGRHGAQTLTFSTTDTSQRRSLLEAMAAAGIATN